jgi:hypothetical protein
MKRSSLQHVAAIFLIALPGACEPARPPAVQATQSSDPPTSIAFEQIGFHPGRRSDLGTYFVVIHVAGIPDSVARRSCLNIGRDLCRDHTVCFVGFWTDPDKAARSLPMRDAQAAAEVASYSKNVNFGTDALDCHPFGAPHERCSAVLIGSSLVSLPVTPAHAAPRDTARRESVLRGSPLQQRAGLDLEILAKTVERIGVQPAERPRAA